MVDGHPLFEQAPGIEINETMANYEEENIMVRKEIPIQHEDNFVNMEIEEDNETNDDVSKEETIEYYEKGMRYAYIIEQDESYKD